MADFESIIKSNMDNDGTIHADAIAKLSKAICTAVGNEFVEKSRYKAKLEEIDTLKSTMQTAEDGATTAEMWKSKYEEIKNKYDDDAAAHKIELEKLQGQLAERDYTDAINKAIADANGGKGIKFSSKSAKTAFETALKAQKLELKDGALSGFDEFVKAQKESDPDAFAPDKPPARFASPVGVGGKTDDTPANVQMAKALGSKKAETIKASNDVFSQYT